MAHPCSPSPKPFSIKGFKVDFLEGLVYETIMGSHSGFSIKIP